MGSPLVKKTARAALVTSAALHAILAMCWWTQNRRRSRAKTNSVTRRVWTTESCPLWSATAWKANPPAAAAQPRSQRGWRIKEGDEIPTTVLVGRTDTGRVRGHEVHCVCQGGGQGEDDGDGHVTTSDRALRSEPLGGF